MSETIIPTPVEPKPTGVIPATAPAPQQTKPPFVYPTQVVAEKLAEVEAFYVKYHGRAGFNPHFFLNKEYLPLKGQHLSPDVPKTEELFKKIMALQCDEANAVAKSGKYYGNRTVIQPAIAGLSKPAVRTHEVKQHALPPMTFNPALSLPNPSKP